MLSRTGLSRFSWDSGEVDYRLDQLDLDQLRLRRSVKWTRYEPDVLPTWVAEMDFPVAEPVKTALSAAIERNDTGYANPDASGLATAFAGFASRRLNWSPDPAGIEATGDVVGGISALLGALTTPGDGVMITPPVYHPFFTVIEEAGCRLIEAPMANGRTLDLDRIESGFRSGARILILCSPHNPAGSVPTRPELEAIAALAAEHEAWVLSDEIHAPLTLPGAIHEPFLPVSAAAAEWGICLSSASKTFNLAGLTCAVLATASDRTRRIVEDLPFGAKHPGHLGVIGAQAAFTQGDDWLDQVLAQLDFNRHRLAELLAEHLPEVGYRMPEAGYLAWLDCRALGLGDDPAEAILSSGRVALSSGPTFGKGGAGYCRMNIGTSPALIEMAVEGMAKSAHCR
ncbi:MAG: aminotransferase class I/II-fold pyridoxal phosphate-dependent enzyme [Thermoleophilia bacterium]|nr:aminotransferase class I/II-fold pyridoxal phosphate-dependent enzyme [Thermoleophilia bacterium]